MSVMDDCTTRREQFEQVLLRIAERCDTLQGAALVGAGGEVLAACGDLWPEAVAQRAAGLPAQLDTQLGQVCRGQVHEALVWTDTGPWYLCRIDDVGHALVLKAGPIEHAATLRYAGGLAAHRVASLLDF